MFSLNVPVPPAVRSLADDLAPRLSGLVPREEHTLLLKRLGALDDHHVAEARVREALAGAPAAEVRVSEVSAFQNPPSGPAPVVYLAVEGSGLYDLHERLCTAVDPVPGLEGEGYVPHVTLARGDDGSLGGPTPRETARRLDGESVGPVTWTVEELHFYDARHGERSGTVSLPA